MNDNASTPYRLHSDLLSRTTSNSGNLGIGLIRSDEGNFSVESTTDSNGLFSILDQLVPFNLDLNFIKYIELSTPK